MVFLIKSLFRTGLCCLKAEIIKTKCLLIYALSFLCLYLHLTMSRLAQYTTEIITWTYIKMANFY
ncbi:hypothetical protein LOTGIDRAFT_139289 [Lottia gigantea]|uniref:Uncharacterized protein n=1 Tax=Lottia gigantea TaxID=225164 RepID=V4B236_LOTGI|nr:hypothetical protein LOTGIDRAFT_139289 [Lottia gigantea]ESP01656.1 hypothetical protein LOTGIDRAFT_139289 [Lottia gigantea]